MCFYLQLINFKENSNYKNMFPELFQHGLVETNFNIRLILYHS